MQYREKLTELILNGDPEAYHTWLLQQPLILQPDIMNEFIEIVQEIAREKGIKLDAEDLEGYTEGTKKYEEAILEEQVAGVNLHLAQLALEDSNKQMEETTQGIKDYVKECVVTNADNAEAMKQLAQQIRQLDIDNGNYVAAQWEWLDAYL